MKGHWAISRRQLLGAAASFATATALFSLVGAIPYRTLVRPPGAIGETQFAGSCIRCGACADVCPVRGIGIAHVTDGLQNVGTPVLSSYCMVFKGLENPTPLKVAEWKSTALAHNQEETCFDCINVCPTGALQQVSVNQLRMGTAVVKKDHCLAYLNGVCGLPCVKTCPFDAISVAGGPVVDETKCVGCGQCDYVCIARRIGPTAIAVEPSQI
jgi:ferredoxin-type protein NapG